MALGDVKTFDIVYAGLVLKVNAIDIGNGEVRFAITCTEGYADLNAFYWGDDVADSSNFDLGTKKDNSLNMNGTGVDFDGGMKLSSAGLGTDGVNKSTFITAGETLTFEGNVNWADLDVFGVRATSTSTAGGSIKGVDSSAVETLAPVACVEDAAPVTEGGEASFTIKLDKPYLYNVTITYETISGSAEGGSDFTVTTGTVTILAGETSAIVKVATTDDGAVEETETFTLKLTGATTDIPGSDVGVTIKCDVATGTILDNDEDGGGGGGGGTGTNHFLDNGHDLSYATFYFGTTSGDVRGVLNGEPAQGVNTPDGVYTVKINFPGGNGGDLDDYYQDIVDYLIANNPNVNASTPILGVGIHAGLGNPATSEVFYAIDGDPDDVDTVPTPPGDLAQNNEIDATLDYTLVFPG